MLKTHAIYHQVQDNTLLREPACNAWLLKYAGSWKRKQKNKTVENAKPAILNTLTPRIGDFVRIRCALCNRFPSTMFLQQKIPTLLISKLSPCYTMLQLSKEPNRLLEYVLTGKWTHQQEKSEHGPNRKILFLKIFPKLSLIFYAI